jgi:exodeoxyribonuclease-3
VGLFCASDYHLATPALAATATATATATAEAEAIDLSQRFSDHAPLTIDHGFTL